jgi:hypothetical protein
MCDPVTATLLVASTALGAGNEYRALQKQDRATAAGIRRQGQLSREAAGNVNQRIAELDRSNPQDAARQRLGEYMTALRRSRADSEGGLPSVPGASSRFTADVAAARAGAANEARETAGRMARIDAPGIVRQKEAIRTGDLANSLHELARRSRAQDDLMRLEVNSIRPNPFIEAIASLGQGFAMGRARNPGIGQGDELAEGMARQARKRTIFGTPAGMLTDPAGPFTLSTQGLS